MMKHWYWFINNASLTPGHFIVQWLHLVMKFDLTGMSSNVNGGQLFYCAPITMDLGGSWASDKKDNYELFSSTSVFHEDVMVWKHFPYHSCEENPMRILSQRANVVELFLVVNEINFWNKLSNFIWFQIPWHSCDITVILTVQYIPRNMHTVFALLCFVVVIHWLIFPYPSGLLHWHCGNLMIAPVPAKQPWWIWINTSCEFIMNDCITTTKQSTTKPCAYFLGYTVYPMMYVYSIVCCSLYGCDFINNSMQNRCNSIANALEFSLFCNKAWMLSDFSWCMW